MPSAPSPLDNLQSLSLRVTIKVNGSAIKDIFGLFSVTITHEINRISHAEIVLNSEINIADNTIPISDSDDFKPGNTVEVTAGYGDVGEASIFKGVIVRHALDIDTDNGYSFRIVCKHEAVSMTFNETAANFLTKTDSDIIKNIIATYGLACAVDATTAENPFVFQHMSTDWDFVLSRAEFNGYIITLDGSDVFVGKPKLTATPVLRLTVGESVMAFSAELIAENQPTVVEAYAWDIKTQKTITSTASEPGMNTQGNLTAKALSSTLKQAALQLMSPTPMDTAELKVWAESVLLRKRLSAFKGTVKFQGSALAKTGSLVELENVGARFNGNAFVSSVKHTIEVGDWTTTVRIGLDNSPISRQAGFSYSPAAGQLPAIHGLQVGTVKKLSADPGSENRIQVELASYASIAATVWARFANFYATSGAGSGFLPEVGDEVVVGFFDNDPRFPVVIGSLYSSKNVSPNPPADENNYIKSITTKAKIKITMDDEKKAVTIETPAGNKIVISDDAKSIEMEDENKNSIKMTSSGITLESAKDITLKATGGITLDATAKVTVTAKQDVALTGLNVTATANVGFTAKGNATAEVSASGQTTIKGAMVMIN